jgi:diphthine synthase
VEKNRRVTIPEALDQLLALSTRSPDQLIRPETLVVGLARLEASDMIVRASTVSDLRRIEFGDPPYCLIFPAKLHFVEAEALEQLCGARRELVEGSN